MKLWTDATDAQGNFDSRYTCDADNSSPELRWEDAPAGTQSFALLMEDLDTIPDSKCHWVVYQIPKHVSHLPAGIPPQDALPNGIRQGLNSWNKLGYAGPCPPAGHRPHRYRFRLFALGQMPQFPQRQSREQVLEGLKAHVLASAEVECRYTRHGIERAG